MSRSPHVQGKLARYMPTMAAMAKEYMDGADTLQASVERIREEIQETHRAAERGRSEGAAFDRNREGNAEMYARAREEGRLT